MSKPPLGVEPTWMVARNRVSDLAKAIDRVSQESFSSKSIDDIRRYASEICMQCEILQWDENNRVGKCVDK